MADTVADDKKVKDVALLVYILQAVGFFIGITWIVALIINYVKRDDVRGTWVESHFEWQIKTFWMDLSNRPFAVTSIPSRSLHSGWHWRASAK